MAHGEHPVRRAGAMASKLRDRLRDGAREQAQRRLGLPTRPPGDGDHSADALDALDRLACPYCGGDLAYAPSIDALLCDFCGERSETPPPTEAQRRTATSEIDLTTALASAADAAVFTETQVIRCGSCGAEEVFSPTARARPCAFCGEPLIAPSDRRRLVEPRALLPFLIDEADAKRRFAAWLKSRWFAPSGLSALARQPRPLTGVYAPFYTFDASTRTEYRGQRGDTYRDHVWRTTMRKGKAVRQRVAVRKVRWRPASGRVARRFDDVLAPASTGLQESLLRRFGAASWDLSELLPYQKAYLAGFVAEAPGVGLEDGLEKARGVMDKVIERDVRSDIGGDLQRISRVSTQVSDVSFRSILLPLWVASYRHDGRVYQALVNGRTGEVIGARPYAIWKLAVAGVIGGLILGAIGAVILSQGG